MAIIRLKRTSEYSNRMRDYKIFIDGQQVGTIANGEIKDFFITVGQHIVSAKIDWCSSPNIFVDIIGNETKYLKVSSFKKSKLLTPISLAFIIIIYHLTIGRKKYLNLEEINEHYFQDRS